MHYQGTKVPLSEKDTRFKSAGMVTRRSWGHRDTGSRGNRKGQEKKLFSFKTLIPSTRAEVKNESRYSFRSLGEMEEKETSRAFPSTDFWNPRKLKIPSVFKKEDSWKMTASSLENFNSVVMGFLVVVLVGVGWWAKQKAVGMLENSPDLRLSRVVVEGEHYLTQEEVLKAANLSIGTQLFRLNLEALDQKLRQISWVEQVFVERDLPSTLMISIRERKPVALLDYRDLYGVDSQGRILSPSEALLNQDLPLISGVSFSPEAVGTTLSAQAIEPALHFFTFLGQKDPVLAHDVSEVDLSEPDALKVTFINGMEATFNPTVDVTDLKRMALVLGDLNEKGKKAETMDFRYRNMVLVRTR